MNAQDLECDAIKRMSELKSQFVREKNLAAVLQKVIETAIAISEADFGNIRVLDEKTQKLRIAAQFGFPQWWIDYWDDLAAKESGACGEAVKRGGQIVIEDIELSPIFANSPSLEIQRKAYVRAVQSTPIISRSGKVLGAFSTHYRTPHKFEPHTLRLLSTVALQTADILELAKSTIELDRVRKLLERGERLAHLGSWEYIVATRETSWSDEEFRIYGLTPGPVSPSYRELLEKHFHPEDSARVDKEFTHALNTASAFECEHRIVRPDGSIRMTLNRAAPHFDELGKLVKYTGVSLDITDSRQMQALRESEERFALAQTAGRVGAWDWDLDTGHIIWTPTTEEIFGYRTGSFAGNYQGWARLIYPEDLQRVENDVKAWLKAPENPTIRLEYRAIRPNGDVRWVVDTSRVIRNNEGRPVRVIGCVRDITDEKTYEMNLRHLSQFPENNPGPVLQTDLDGQMTYSNPSARQWLLQFEGLPEGQLPEAIKAHAERAQNAKGPIEAEILNSVGETYILAAVHLPDLKAVNLYATNITELKRADAQLAQAKNDAEFANRQKDIFLSMLGHELRNPLAPIRYSVGLLKFLDSPDPRAQRAFDVIDRQVTHMVRIVDDLLDVSRIARGKIRLRKQAFDLVSVLEAVITDHRPSFDAAGVHLNFVPPGGGLWLNGDSARLAQILINLMDNAAKFTERDGSVTVKLTLATDNHARISVRDTGVGMEPETLERIFEPFAQADRSLDRSHGGLGLGLALVKGIVALHGGSVAALSNGLGSGSEFLVTLPGVIEKPAVAEPKTQSTKLRPLRILVVEDNFDAADSMRELLEYMGHEIRIAHSGNEGLALARTFKPEVVICDIGLPSGMNGYEVARAMRSDEELCSIHLVALTGYGESEDRRRGIEAGFEHYLTKPAEIEVLRTLLAQFAAAPAK